MTRRQPRLTLAGKKIIVIAEFRESGPPDQLLSSRNFACEISATSAGRRLKSIEKKNCLGGGKFGIIAKCLTPPSLPPPPPPPDCKVLGRLAVASALTLAAVVAAANPAQAHTNPDEDALYPNFPHAHLAAPPCAADHYEAPGTGKIPAGCIPNSGPVFAIDSANANREGRAFCAFFGGNVRHFGSPWCLGDYVGKTGGTSGNCQIGAPNSCPDWFRQIRDCNKTGSNRKASVDQNSVITCGDACGTGEQAVGGNCRDSGPNCSGDEVPNEAGDACVCPPAKPVRDLSGACAEQCGPGEEPDQAMQCGLCGTGHFNADGLGACDLCFPPLTESSPGESSLAGLEIREGVSGRATGCEPIDECGPEDGDPHERHDLELCGPNAACNDLDPRDNPSGFTVGEWRYRCECAEDFADPAQGDHENKLNCSGTGTRTVAILDSDNGTVLSTPPAGELDFETEVVFTAAPDLGFMVSAWAGVDEWVGPGNCAAGATRCAVTVTRALEARAVFADADECASDLDDCPSDSSCVNLDAAAGGGRFECDCDDASLDHDSGLGICTGFRTVTILASSGGTVSSGSVGEVTHGSGAVFTAAAALGFTVGAWSGVAEWVGPGNCEAGSARCAVTVTRDVTVGAAFPDLDECAAGSDDCPSASSCVNLDAALGGGRFTCECDLAVSDFGFDEATRACGCATAGHLLFGEGAGRECKSPVICPSGYGDANFDCVEDEATPLAPEQVSSRELCLAFGGVREAVVDSAHPGVCSNVDINDTFCFLESGEALSCRGLFEHVRDCNALNRPALDPWHCAAACGDKQARGRRCETVTR